MGVCERTDSESVRSVHKWLVGSIDGRNEGLGDDGYPTPVKVFCASVFDRKIVRMQL